MTKAGTETTPTRDNALRFTAYYVLPVLLCLATVVALSPLVELLWDGALGG